MWIILFMLGLLFWMVGSAVKQLAITTLGRFAARAMYVLAWVCFLAAGIDVARTYNLYAPLLTVCGVLMFYATIAVLHSDTLEQRYRAVIVFRWAASCFATGIALLIAAILNFAAWAMRSGVLLLAVALAASGCSGNGDDDTPFWIVIFGVALLIAFILGWTSEECSRCKRVMSRSKIVGGICDECRKRGVS